jgi:hypothetical protein
MKSILLSLLLASSVQARIGWTLEDCRKNYGPEVKVNPAWCGGTAYSFIKNDLYVYAIIPNKESKVADVSYFNNLVAQPLANAMCEKLWLLNQNPGPIWDAGSASDWLNWNGRKSYKNLGLETGYEHIVQYSRDSKYCNVGNRSKNGYQVRTLKQFYKEQKVIKALIKDEAKASKRS